jgi:hypothetical protein
MRLDTEFEPRWRMWALTENTGEIRSATAIVSPRARPRPSMVAPIAPPLPNGSTTHRIIPQRVAPSANAPSRSPAGACEKTSRITEQAMGAAIMATTIPAMNVEAVKMLWDANGLPGSTPFTLNMGIHENHVASHRERPIARPCRMYFPQSPYTTLGTAAMRSTIDTNVCLYRGGAISDTKSAVPSARGIEITIATNAIRTVPLSTAAMPKRWASGCQLEVVRNDNPATFRA